MLYSRHRRCAGISRRSRQLHIDGTMHQGASMVVRGNSARVPGWASAEAHADAIRTFRPTVITGVPSTLLELADHLEEEVRVDLITTMGEVLSAADRDELRRTYGA